MRGESQVSKKSKSKDFGFFVTENPTIVAGFSRGSIDEADKETLFVYNRYDLPVNQNTNGGQKMKETFNDSNSLAQVKYPWGLN